MINIRFGTFETNSSSVHTLTLCSIEEYEKWKRGELLYVVEDFIYNEDIKTYLDCIEQKGAYGYKINKKFVTYEEANLIDKYFPYPTEISNDFYESEFKDENGEWHIKHFISYQDFDWCFNGYYTTYKEVCPEKDIVAFGYYGRDS